MRALVLSARIKDLMNQKTINIMDNQDYVYQAGEELAIPREVMELCSQSGDMTKNVQDSLANNELIKSQYNALSEERVRYDLREYGAWSDDELSNHQDNLERLLWLACCDISERIDEYEEIDYDSPAPDWQQDC